MGPNGSGKVKATLVDSLSKSPGTKSLMFTSNPELFSPALPEKDALIRNTQYDCRTCVLTSSELASMEADRTECLKVLINTHEFLVLPVYDAGGIIDQMKASFAHVRFHNIIIDTKFYDQNTTFYLTHVKYMNVLISRIFQTLLREHMYIIATPATSMVLNLSWLNPQVILTDIDLASGNRSKRQLVLALDQGFVPTDSIHCAPFITQVYVSSHELFALLLLQQRVNFENSVQEFLDAESSFFPQLILNKPPYTCFLTHQTLDERTTGLLYMMCCNKVLHPIFSFERMCPLCHAFYPYRTTIQMGAPILAQEKIARISSKMNKRYYLQAKDLVDLLLSTCILVTQEELNTRDLTSFSNEIRTKIISENKTGILYVTDFFSPKVNDVLCDMVPLNSWSGKRAEIHVIILDKPYI